MEILNPNPCSNDNFRCFRVGLHQENKIKIKRKIKLKLRSSFVKYDEKCVQSPSLPVKCYDKLIYRDGMKNKICRGVPHFDFDSFECRKRHGHFWHLGIVNKKLVGPMNLSQLAAYALASTVLGWFVVISDAAALCFTVVYCCCFADPVWHGFGWSWSSVW